MIASVQKAIAILTLVADNQETPVPLQEISGRTGINKSTCSHIVETLIHEGFLVKISSSKGYILGPAAYCLSRFGRYGTDLISICRPVMQYLYKTLGHCIVLAVIEGNEKYVIDYIDDGDIFEQKQRIQRDDIYRTATGRAILKNMSEREVSTIWEKYGRPKVSEWPEIQTLDDLLSYRDGSASQDIVFTRAERKDGVVHCGYGAPLWRNGKCVGALGVAVKFSAREEKAFVSREENNIKNLLSKGAAVISGRL